MATEQTGFARAFRTGMIAGVVFVLVAGVALGVYTLAGGALPGKGRSDASRVLLIVALPDENGDIVAQLIADIDASGATVRPIVRSVDPTTPVTVAGTSFDRLRDSYPFGGGARVASCYARLAGGEPLPYIDLGPEAVEALLDASGGITLDLPRAMNVFDGERLYTLSQGPVTADAVEFRAIVNGAGYLPTDERKMLLQQACERVSELLVRYPGGIGAAVDGGVVATDLDPAWLESLVAELAR